MSLRKMFLQKSTFFVPYAHIALEIQKTRPSENLSDGLVFICQRYWRGLNSVSGLLSLRTASGWFLPAKSLSCQIFSRINGRHSQP